MTDLLQWAMIIFMAASAAALFAIAADILSRCPELQNRIEILEEALSDYHGQHRCGCQHPACKRCEDDERIDDAAGTGRARGISPIFLVGAFLCQFVTLPRILL